MRLLGIDALGRRAGGAAPTTAGKRPAPRGPAPSRRGSKAARGAHGAPASPPRPTRRSTRSTRASGAVVDDVSEAALLALGAPSAAAAARRRRAESSRTVGRPSDENPASDDEDGPETFDDSSVVRYACRASASASREAAFSSGARARLASSRRSLLVGFEEVEDVVFHDPACKKGFYALDAHDPDDDDAFVGRREGAASDARRRGAASLRCGGGDGGRVAVWALGPAASSSSDADSSDASDSDRSDSDDRSTRRVSPLMSWVAHRGWCAQAIFVPRGGGVSSVSSADDASSSAPLPAIFSAGGMDGALRLWDVRRASARTGAPPTHAACVDAHPSAGVFSADACRPEAASYFLALTGSKDATSCVTRWSDDRGGAKVERRFEGHHHGVVKCVRWRVGGGVVGSVFATCGNDGRVAVMDARAERAECGAFEDAHGGAPAHFVEWGGGAFSGGGSTNRGEHALLSAGGDRVVRVWDTRRFATSGPGGAEAAALETIEMDAGGDDENENGFVARRKNRPELVAELEGHVAASVARPKMMYHPVFVREGARAGAGAGSGSGGFGFGLAVATPGEGSRGLSLYRDATEPRVSGPRSTTSRTSVVSRGDVGFDATAVMARRGGAGGALAWALALADRGEVRLYRPKWGRAGGGRRRRGV